MPKKTDNYSITAELLELLTEDEFVALSENYGGIAIYIAADPGKNSYELPFAVKMKLASSFGGTYLNVPLAREVRAPYYRRRGDSKRAIARRLLITERAVERLFKRITPKLAQKAAPADRQIDMIDYIRSNRPRAG